MAKEFFVLRGSKVVFKPGHYDIEGARSVATAYLKRHPRSQVHIVQIIESYAGEKKHV